MGGYIHFMLTPAHIGHPVAFALLVCAELIGMSQFAGMWITILAGRDPVETPQVARMKQEILEHGTQLPKLPFRIAAFITVAGEPLETVRKTALAARDMTLPHETYILDDGASDDVQDMARELNVHYIRRDTNEGRKAGNVNNALALVESDYVAIFDADHVPKLEFLLETIPHLEANQNLAYVQTPQYFGNRDTFISAGTAEAQEAFYRHVQPAKNAFNAAFCVGTNVIFRRSALDELGGIYQQSNSEDIWTSILLHERGWDSFFLPTVLAIGEAPDTVANYFKQQFRWSRGGFEILLTHNPLRQKLTLDQKLQYLHTSMHYLIGVVMFIFYLLPLLYVYLDWKPFQTAGDPFAWTRAFVPYFFMIIVTTMHLMGTKSIWRSFVTTISAFPSHMAAFFSVLTGLNMNWSVTGVIRRRSDYVMSVAPHILLLLLSLGAIPLALMAPQEDGTSITIVFWLLWNSMVLLSICKLAIPRFNYVSKPAISPQLHYVS